MTIQHYQDRAMSTCMDTCMNPVYMLMNLGAEVGELQGKIAKAVRSGVADINENRLVSREQVGMEYIHPFMESLAYDYVGLKCPKMYLSNNRKKKRQ